MIASGYRTTTEREGEPVTDGVTEGQHEPAHRHEQPAAPAEDMTTTLVMQPPAGEPARAESGVGPRVMLLGSGEFSRELAIALHRLGAMVIVVDSYPDAPAHRVADQALVASLTDAAALAPLIKRMQPDFVVTATDAVSCDVLDSLADLGDDSEAGWAKLVPSARSVRLTADREGLRRLAADELGLPTAPFWFAGSLVELEAVAAHAGFPLLVRPVAGNAVHGHSVVTGPDDVERAWRDAVAGADGHDAPGAQPRVLAETMVEVESHFTVLVVCGEATSGPAMEFCAPIGCLEEESGELESWQPQKMSAAALDATRSIAARIVRALGGRGVFSVELMLNGDEVYFVNVDAFPAESAWVTLRSQRLSVFELQARVILGVPVDTMLISPAAARVIGRCDTGRVAALDAGVLSDAFGVPESDIQVFGQAARSESADAPRRLGVVLATAPDVQVARDRAREVANRLNMQDSRG